MENLKQPANAFTAFFDRENTEPYYGFTKLERASLIIAQGFAANGVFNGAIQEDYELSRRCAQIAKAVLEEANK